MRTSLLLTALSLICLPLPGTGPAHAQATRTWVSGLGDDINSCTRTAPCKTFAGAISKTASGGEIDCLDAGGFGPVTITKSMTIDCTGTFGSILATGTTGVTVNGAGIAVNLRGLSINGATTGTIGINFVAGYSLNLDKVNVINFISGAATAILFAPNSNGAILNVNDCYVYYNGNTPNGGGIVVEPATGGTAVVTISNCRINDNSDGVRSMGTNGLVVMTIRDSTISDNTLSGINSTATSVIMADRNTISSNLTNGVLSSGASSTVRLYNNSIFANVNGVTASNGGVVHSYKNNAINGNLTDGTPLTQELLQ